MHTFPFAFHTRVARCGMYHVGYLVVWAECEAGREGGVGLVNQASLCSCLQCFHDC